MKAVKEALACPAWCDQPHGVHDRENLRQHCRILRAPSSNSLYADIYVFQYDTWDSRGGWSRERHPHFRLSTLSGSYTVASPEHLESFLPAVKALAPELVGLVAEAAALCGFTTARETAGAPS